MTDLRDAMRWANDYYLWAIGATTATLALFGLLRQMFPKAAVIVATPFRAITWCCRMPVRIIHWLWRQAWLQKVSTGPDAVWVYRGPVMRAMEPRRRARRVEIATIVADVVDPRFEETQRRAAKQHDDQNVVMNDMKEQLARLEKLAADETARRIEKVEGRVRDLEEVATLPTNKGRKATTKEG